MIQPETRFATVGNDRVAYQVVGQGARDILYTSGFWNHLDIEWEDPELARFYRRLASFARLIRFDRRGTGVSDQPADDGLSAVEHWLQDCAAVLDTVQARAPVIFGEGTPDVGPLVLHYVDRHPERCSGLIFGNTGACPLAMADYPEGFTADAIRQLKDDIRRTYGSVELASAFATSRAGDESFQRWWAKLCRAMASPRAVADNLDCWDELDCRLVLPRVRVPTLVIAASHSQMVPIEQSRYLARNISGARFVELPGADVLLCWLAPDRVDLVEEFVTGRRHGGEAERTVVTVLFTDIVDSTGHAAQKGNAAWRQLLDRHDQAAREQVALYGGRFMDSSGDGTLTTFDSPGRAIDCAHALSAALKPLGIRIRAGLHTGEVELRDDGRVGGMAVHIGARIMAMASAGEVLVSYTVHGVLMGSRYEFEERGVHELKGVPGRWPLFATTAREQP
jgi:class 3 adenylate cyclase